MPGPGQANQWTMSPALGNTRLCVRRRAPLCPRTLSISPRALSLSRSNIPTTTPGFCVPWDGSSSGAAVTPCTFLIAVTPLHESVAAQASLTAFQAPPSTRCSRGSPCTTACVGRWGGGAGGGGGVWGE